MSINNVILARLLSGKAFETKSDSNSIEHPHPRAASFKQLYRTRPAQLPEPPAHLLWGASDTALAFLASFRIADNPAIVPSRAHYRVGQAAVALMLYTQRFPVQNRSDPSSFRKV